MKTIPRNKAAGVDEITTEAILACGEIGITWLTTIFHKIWKERKVPENWQRAVQLLIWKKKSSKKDCCTCRGMSLLSHTGKIYSKILERRNRYKVEPLPSDAHIGFRKVRGCTDAIFVLRQQSEKAIECNRELNIVFVDQVKAFDRVNRDKPCTVLETYNLKGQFLDNFRAIYAKSMSSVRTPNELTYLFQVTTGVRQGVSYHHSCSLYTWKR